MAEEYADHFARIQDLIDPGSASQVNWPIFDVTRDPRTEKLIDLFLDSFDHHTQWTDALPSAELTLLPKEERRFIARDQLLVRFIDRYYAPPKILRSPYISPPYENKHFISFDDFVRDVQSNPITADPQVSLELGSNTYTYVVGDVGIGKSLFVMSLFRRIIFGLKGGVTPYAIKDSKGYTVVPVYINVDEESTKNGHLAELDSNWFAVHIVDEIVSRFQASEHLEAASEINKFQDPATSSFINRARKLTQHLARRKFRVLLLIDNVDRYHFHYSKYRFSDKYKYKQREAVVANLKRLISCFTSRRELGWCGLCVVLVCRDYVYEYLRVGCADPSEKDREFGRAHKLVLETDSQVTRARLDLFREAVGKVPVAQIGESGKDYLNALETLLESPDQLRTKLRPEVELLLRLGNHGYRSLVDFLDKLEFNLSDKEVFSRLLERQRKNLPTLFLLNLKRRFSQSAGHFPNVFLIDSQISVHEDFSEAHQPHRPTYWLKYFILKSVIRHRSRRLSELIRLFSKVGEYEEHLVRLAIGSLCSTNDSRCLDVDASTEVAGNADPVLFATPRGTQLVSPSDAFGDAGLDFCFEFNYLQLAVDDIWLSVPREWGELVAVQQTYDYLIDGTEHYGELAWSMVRAKAHSTIAFSTILGAALRIEMKRMPSLRGYLTNNKLLPDMTAVRDALLATSVELYRIFKRTPTEVEELKQHYESCKQRDGELDQFFEKVAKGKLLVA